MNFQRIVLLVLVLFLCSCGSQKKFAYLQDRKDQSNAGTMPEFTLTISPNDILSIQVLTVNTEAFPGIASTVDKQVIDNRSSYEKGFIVDKFGFVELPLIGKVNLAGLTITDARDTLVQRFEFYMDAPVVILKKLSFKITILGEVNKPGLYYVENEKITLFEALGLAGDLTIFGSREDLKLIRRTKDGYREIIIDLTTKASLNTEVAYLHPDDVLYVKPIGRRGAATLSPSVLIVTSVLTTIILVVSVILREK
ncbi:MAG: polysaccharide biosynthesis/export family protein [Bacteroidota bacterium]|nr:polysaccharide biosynthesis/export family protein [Bacteroidota bacterium]